VVAVDAAPRRRRQAAVTATASTASSSTTSVVGREGRRGGVPASTTPMARTAATTAYCGGPALNGVGPGRALVRGFGRLGLLDSQKLLGPRDRLG